jgi:hypothetical protein
MFGHEKVGIGREQDHYVKKAAPESFPPVLVTRIVRLPEGSAHGRRNGPTAGVPDE